MRILRPNEVETCLKALLGVKNCEESFVKTDLYCCICLNKIRMVTCMRLTVMYFIKVLKFWFINCSLFRLFFSEIIQAWSRFWVVFYYNKSLKTWNKLQNDLWREYLGTDWHKKAIVMRKGERKQGWKKKFFSRENTFLWVSST